MVTHPNPSLLEIHFAQLQEAGQIGDLWDAARTAGVQPGTIRVWVTRGKIEPILHTEHGPLYHLPTVKRAAEHGRRYAPKDPAANRRRARAA